MEVWLVDRFVIVIDRNRAFISVKCHADSLCVIGANSQAVCLCPVNTTGLTCSERKSVDIWDPLGFKFGYFSICGNWKPVIRWPLFVLDLAAAAIHCLEVVGTYLQSCNSTWVGHVCQRILDHKLPYGFID